MAKPSDVVTTSSTDIVVYRPPPDTNRRAIETSIDSIFRRSLELQKHEAKHLRQFGRERIFVVFGTSTAGKTRIIRQLGYEDPRWVEKGCDLAYRSYDGALIQKYHPEQFQRMARAIKPIDIALSIVYEDYIPPINPLVPLGIVQDARRALDEVKQTGNVDITPEALYDDIDRQLFDGVRDQSLSGNPVVFDTIDPEDFLEYLVSRNFSAPIRMGLVYCPFSELAQRVTRRNREALGEQGDKDNARDSLMPLFQFASLYEPAKPGEVVLETLTRHQVEEAFETGYEQQLEALKDDPKQQRAVAGEHDTKKWQLLSELGFSATAHKVEVNPVFSTPNNPSFIESKEVQKKITPQIYEQLRFSDPTVNEVNITPKFKGFQYLFNSAVMRPEESVASIRRWNIQAY